VYRSIVYEVIVEGELYVLTGGDWFRINLNFKQRVYDEANGLDRRDGLPLADHGTDEDTYNLQAAETMDALCLDKKLVFDGGPDRMEICDVLTRDGGFIHVKQRGSSSTLSHLFTQGLNSAERFYRITNSAARHERSWRARIHPLSTCCRRIVREIRTRSRSRLR
jgi:uncharacterized protein (TIGR04141 family)